MRHVQYEWVLAYMHESVMVHTSESWLSHGTYRGVTAHILRIQKGQQPLSHGTNESVMSSRSAATASWHIWICHVTRTSAKKVSSHSLCHFPRWWVLSRMQKSWHVCRSHGACERVMAHMNESWNTRLEAKKARSYWVMAHINVWRHVWIESWHLCTSHGTYAWFMADLDESWLLWMSHGTYERSTSRMNWVTSRHTRMSPGTHMGWLRLVGSIKS